MAKTKSTFFCQNCGTQFSKWQGQCTACKEWNTIAEEVIQKAEKASWKSAEATTKRAAKPQKIADISGDADARLNTKNNELNRVLGGGLVPGSLTLLGGEPGIGKSTLMLQIALQLPIKHFMFQGKKVHNRSRCGPIVSFRILKTAISLTETKTQNIFRNIEELQPDIVVIDSIQTLHTDYIESSAGSISQIRETTTELNKVR